MKTWNIEFAVHGKGYAVVEAETEEAAREMLSKGPYVEAPTLEEWDINPHEDRGGYVGISEEKNP